MAAVPAAAWLHPAVAVGASPIAGRGLFATAAMPRGTVVIRLGGRVVPRREFERLVRAARADPALPYVDGITLDGDSDLLLAPGSRCRYGNHSCDPNLWWTGALTLATRRDVAAGEELTHDYAASTAHEDFRMPCRCGSALCRGEVTGADWRRDDLQRRYGGHWIPALRRRMP